MSTQQILSEVRQPESRTNLVTSIPVQEGQKLSLMAEIMRYPWQEIQGLSWTVNGVEEDYQ